MKTRRDMLARAPVGPLLLKLSAPAIVGMAVMALYNTVDAFFVGRGVGPDGIAGLTVSFPAQILMLGLGLLIGIGGSSIISRALGASDQARAERTLGNLLTLTLLVAAMAAAAGVFVNPAVLRLLGADDEVASVARQYLRIILCGGVFTFFNIVAHNVMRAEGNVRAATLTMIVGAGLNILLDPLFIMTFGWGVTGAAAATVLANAIQSVVIVVYFAQSRSLLRFRFAATRLSWPLTREILTVGSSAFARNVGGCLMMIAVNRALTTHGGNNALVVFGIMFRLNMFLFMPMFGIVQGFQPIAGFNFGAGNLLRVRRTITWAAALCSVISITGFMMLISCPGFLVGLFTPDPGIRALARHAIPISALALPTVGFQIVVATMYQAFGRAIPALILSSCRQILILIPLVLVLPTYIGLDGIWASFPIADGTSALLSLALFITEMKRLSSGGDRATRRLVATASTGANSA